MFNAVSGSGTCIKFDGNHCSVHGDGMDAVWKSPRPFIQINLPEIVYLIRRQGARHIAYIDGRKFGTGEVRTHSSDNPDRVYYSFKLGHSRLLAFKQKSTEDKSSYVVQYAGTDNIVGVFSIYDRDNSVTYRVEDNGMESVLLLVVAFVIESLIWREIASLCNIKVNVNRV